VHPGRWVIRPASIASAGCPGSSVATVCSSVMVCLFLDVDARSVSTVSGWPWGIRQKCSTSHQVVGFCASRLHKPARAVTDASLSTCTTRWRLPLDPHPAPIPFGDQQCGHRTAFVPLLGDWQTRQTSRSTTPTWRMPTPLKALDALLKARPHLANRKPRGDVGLGQSGGSPAFDLPGLLRQRAG
jgi:hypothetical protein